MLFSSKPATIIMFNSSLERFGHIFCQFSSLFFAQSSTFSSGFFRSKDSYNFLANKTSKYLIKLSLQSFHSASSLSIENLSNLINQSSKCLNKQKHNLNKTNYNWHHHFEASLSSKNQSTPWACVSKDPPTSTIADPNRPIQIFGLSFSESNFPSLILDDSLIAFSTSPHSKFSEVTLRILAGIGVEALAFPKELRGVAIKLSK